MVGRGEVGEEILWWFGFSLPHVLWVTQDATGGLEQGSRRTGQAAMRRVDFWGGVARELGVRTRLLGHFRAEVMQEQIGKYQARW